LEEKKGENQLEKDQKKINRGGHIKGLWKRRGGNLRVEIQLKLSCKGNEGKPARQNQKWNSSQKAAMS